MVEKKGAYSMVLNRTIYESGTLHFEKYLPQQERDFHFAMNCNGHFQLRDMEWVYKPEVVSAFTEEFRGQSISFFGPNNFSQFFYKRDIGFHNFFVLNEKSVTDLIGKYRQIDQDQAARIAFILGGMVHCLTIADQSDEYISRVVKYMAQMTMFGEAKNGDAIVSAMAMYIISGGPLEDDDHFSGNVRYMVQAISEDPVYPFETEDLGLSQVARLRLFWDKQYSRESHPLSDIEEDKRLLQGFPTIGAEFHLTTGNSDKHPEFWQRLAILNMSAYQRGSYVQLSRNDRDVIEVRMNPSIYPISIANWNHIRLLIPELNQAFFWVTVNRKATNFLWTKSEDQQILRSLRALGLLSYASLFGSVSKEEAEGEVNFGSIYLGQTVKLQDGEYLFSGLWNGGEGDHGQVSIYAGFGEIFPHLAYYLSMVLAKPSVLKELPENLAQIRSLSDALEQNQDYMKRVFTTVQRQVLADETLSRARSVAEQISHKLNP